MALSSLTAVTPIDGRYYNNTNELSAFFSEFALIKYRVRVEVEYFIALSESGIAQLQQFDKTLNEKLRDIYRNFSEEDAIWIKNTEKVTNHDVKAVEYFLKDQFEKLGLQDYLEFIHFGLTSQDINNTAIPLSWKEAINESYTPAIEELLHELKSLATSWSDIPMLARTHGQPASPTRLGKEFYVFIERIERQLQLLHQVPYSAKFGGATGNFNAHHVAYPATNWVDFGNNFVNISMEYFKQKITAGQIGSSAMPHKVNPIDFENAEGNLGIANAIFEHLAAKLPISRLQRDLTDSTVLRNIGVPFAHTLIAIKSTLRGLRKLILNEQALANDLENNWAVVAEALQTILRREGYPKPYEALKDLTRTNTHVTKETIATFVDNLNVSEEVKEELKAISPANYTGVSL